MVVINLIKDLMFVKGRVTHDLNDRYFEWNKLVNNKEVPLTNKECDILIKWFSSYPKHFINNYKSDEPKYVSGLTKNRIHIKSTEFRDFIPSLDYTLDFDVIGCDISDEILN